MFTLHPTLRRVVYVSLFETFAIVLSTGLLALLTASAPLTSLPVAVAVSVIAVVWNFLFNTTFERWERATQRGARSVRRRTAHTLLFEAGLLVLTVPLYMWWYSVGPWQALKMEAALLLFFLVFTFVFTWVFDTVVPLPGHADKQAC